MTAQKHKIEIDAHAAYMKLGVNLQISPIAEKCVESLRRRLERSITTGLLADALGDAVHAGKPRRGPKKSGVTGGTQQEGSANEA